MEEKLMSDVRNCRKCGKLFNHISGMPICPACRAQLEESFQTVKKYIRENPHTDIKEVAEACEVEPGQIQQWIREERLEFTADSPVKLPCENCGTMIRSGKLCDKCKSQLASNLSHAIEKPRRVIEEPAKKSRGDGNKMRFLDR